MRDRASGSSSTINADMLSIKICTKRHENSYLHATIFFVSRDAEKVVVSIERPQPAASILESDSFPKGQLTMCRIQSKAVVIDSKSKLVADLCGRDADNALAASL